MPCLWDRTAQMRDAPPSCGRTWKMHMNLWGGRYHLIQCWCHSSDTSAASPEVSVLPTWIQSSCEDASLGGSCWGSWGMQSRSSICVRLALLTTVLTHPASLIASLNPLLSRISPAPLSYMLMTPQPNPFRLPWHCTGQTEIAPPSISWPLMGNSTGSVSLHHVYSM